MTFEAIWINLGRASHNLIMPCSIWKATRRIKCNSPISWNLIFLWVASEQRMSKLLGSQPTYDKFVAKNVLWLLTFLYVVHNAFGSMHKNFIWTARSGKCPDLLSKVKLVFPPDYWIFERNKMTSQSRYSQPIKYGIIALCIFVYW